MSLTRIVPAFGGTAIGQTGGIARLILLNGPPGVGKTSLARRFLADHPLALMVDIDDLRTRLGQWGPVEQSRAIARQLAVVLAGAHLETGHDVVIPQYVGRLEFIERLEALAERHGATFVEVILVSDSAVSASRFRCRRDELEAQNVLHPESEVNAADIDDVISDAIRRFVDIGERRPATRPIPANNDLAATYAALLEATTDTAC